MAYNAEWDREKWKELHEEIKNKSKENISSCFETNEVEKMEFDGENKRYESCIKELKVVLYDIHNLIFNLKTISYRFNNGWFLELAEQLYEDGIITCTESELDLILNTIPDNHEFKLIRDYLKTARKNIFRK
jgi:hypothetical protein